MAKSKRKPKKSVYKLTNWSEYNESLKHRGSLTIWFSEDMLAHWYHQGPTTRGGQTKYADIAIELGLTIRQVYQLAYRQTEGFLCSIVELMNVVIDIPDYTTLCRRQKKLNVSISARRSNEPLHVVVDSTGVKVYGEGEWKVRQHGYSKRRTWRKLHLAVNESTGEIQACELTTNAVDDADEVVDLLDQIDDPINTFGADGAYDKRKVYHALLDRAEHQSIPIAMIIPPQRNAKIWQHGNCKTSPHPRDENLRYIRKHGRKKWKNDKEYHRRSISETAMFRYKTTFGSTLKSRTFENQAVEMRIGCKILNKMNQIGSPNSYKID